MIPIKRGQILQMLGDLPVISGVNAVSKSASGYLKLDNGLIIQWGRFSTSNGWNTRINFPISFPSICQSVSVTHDLGGSAGSAVYQGTCGVKARTNVGFYGGGLTAGNLLTYMAIGY